MCFSVTNPQKFGKHIKYEVHGEDSIGAFDALRRYSEFWALRNSMTHRWPGIYIPAIPEKKVVGNKTDAFIEERRLLLEKFLKECAKYDYVLRSAEFKLFSREKGEIDKLLHHLPPQSPTQILEKYRACFTVDESLNQERVLRHK